MRRWLISAFVAAGVLATPIAARADGGASGGGWVADDGTPVAEVSTGGTSGSAPRRSEITCTYARVGDSSIKVYEVDGTEIVHDEPGYWYVKRCFNSAGDEVASETVWIGVVDPADLAAQARKALPLPLPEVGTSPDAGGDQLVGVPTWLWINGGWAPASATAALPGASVTVTAVPDSVTWEMGDGTKVVCRGPGTPYDARRPSDQQTTDCSHTYRRSSAGQPNDRFAVAATVTWRASWTASGVAGGGSLGAVTRTTRFGLRVAEAQALNG